MCQQIEGIPSELRGDAQATRDPAGRSSRPRPAAADAAARRDFYRFLAAVYLGPPEADLLRHILDEDFLEELSALFGGHGLVMLKEIAADCQIEETLPSLRQEYMDLFAVPTGRYVTPFEDVYRGKSPDGVQERGPLLGSRAIAVKRIYRAAGARMDRECRELPTHVGVELSFMGLLCAREAEALRRESEEGRRDPDSSQALESECYRELQGSFLQEHLSVWFPQLSAAVQSCALSSFYQGLALLTEEFLVWDAAQLTCRTARATS
ncbi:MAG: molecular chaperone TorD family protein [Thermoanaerobaculia bacterium]